ncbi:type II toxin-antitoxin system CcdA family antitoxin [Immundisolibacter sp.]
MRINTPEKIPMQPTYDTQAPKRPANLSINGDLLSRAKALDINLSATLEQALAAAVRERRRAQWLAQNKTAIAAYNDHVEQHGIFSDELRSF